MESTAIDSWLTDKDDLFILRLCKDTLEDKTVIYNVSLEVELGTMVEVDFEELPKARKLFENLKKSLKQLTKVH